MKKSLLLLALTVIAVFAISSPSQDPSKSVQPTAYGIAHLVPAEGSAVGGKIVFLQTEKGLVVFGTVNGLVPNSVHGFHIHEYGDLTARDGTSLGGHFNPSKSPHGLPGAAQTHSGDMGNITADANCVANFRFSYANASLTGENSVLGRGVVVHANPDDGGQPTGNAGGRIAYGVIGLATESVRGDW